MEETLTAETTAPEPGKLRDTAKYQAEIQHLFMAMEQADERIQQHHSQTDRLRAETRAILAALKVT